MPKIFISYRREDSDYAVSAISEHLRSAYGNKNVFIDVDAIPAGYDFRQYLGEAVSGCEIVLAVIGDKWLDMKEGSGRRRLDLPDDFVRIELESALARQIPVLPVFVDRVKMPHPSQLPQSLTALSFRQGLSVRAGKDQRHDLEALRREIERACSIQVPHPRDDAAQVSKGSRRRRSAALLGAIALVAWAIWQVWSSGTRESVTAATLARSIAQRQAGGAESQDGRPSIAIMAIGTPSANEANLGAYARGTIFAHLSDYARSSFRVQAQEMIDWEQAESGKGDFAVAQTLHLNWMVSGELRSLGDILTLQLDVVYTPTGELFATIRGRAPRDNFAEFERVVNDASVQLLDKLSVAIPPDERSRLLRGNSGSSEKIASEFMDTMGLPAASPTVPPAPGPGSALDWFTIGRAFAAENSSSGATVASETEVRTLIEKYRLAIQTKDVARLSQFYLRVDDEMKAAWVRYFDHAHDLAVTFNHIEVNISGKSAVATFTRRDDFIDANTTRPVVLEVRVSTVCELSPHGWRIVGLLKPS